MFISAINDFTTFDDLDFTLINALPDDVVAIKNANRETWVFGEESIQVYYNNGAAAFPFTRMQSGVIKTGCNAPRSVAEAHGTLFWVGHDDRVYVSNGYRAQAISTTAIDKIISGSPPW